MGMMSFPGLSPRSPGYLFLLSQCSHVILGVLSEVSVGLKPPGMRNLSHLPQ